MQTQTHIFKIDNPFSVGKSFNGGNPKNINGTETAIVELTIKCRIDSIKHCEFSGDIDILYLNIK